MKINEEIKVKIYKKKIILLSLVIVFIVGLLFGSIYLSVIDNENKKVVINSVKEYIYGFNKINFVNKLEIFKTSLFRYLSYFLSIWLLGISVIGLPIIILMLFFNAFSTGFSISSIFALFKFKGIIGIIFYMFPSNIIFILYSLFLGAYSIDISLKLGKYALKKKAFNFNSFMNKYFLLLLISIILSVLMSLSDAFLSPTLFKLFTKLLK